MWSGGQFMEPQFDWRSLRFRQESFSDVFACTAEKFFTFQTSSFFPDLGQIEEILGNILCNVVFQ